MVYSMSGSSEQLRTAPREHIGFDPVAEAFENGIPLAEEGRKITPWTAGPHDPKHRFDETAIITSAAPRIAPLAEAMRFHLRPLGISQHESFRPKLESQPSLRRNLEGSVRSRGENGPADGRECDLIEAGLNEPLPRR
jgi:hypothetical protein